MRTDVTKKMLCLVLSMAMLLTLVACGNTAQPEQTQPSTEAPTTEATQVSTEPASEPSAESPVQTQTFNGKEYVKLYTLVCDASLTTIDSQFDSYFETTAEEGVRAISKAGNVFVNGQQIPYMREDGTYSCEKLVVNGEDAIWPVDGGWAWKAHLQRQWDDSFFMPNVEQDYTPGTPVDLETATYLYTKHIAYLVGQTVEFYAEVGSEYTSLISTTYYTSTLVGDLKTADGLVHVIGTDGQELEVTFPEANFDEAIQPEDMMIYWEDGVQGWTAKRAVSVTGKLVENTDPSDASANKHPYFLADGATETITTGDSYIGKNFGEAFRHTQFIRGERRTDQYNNPDEVIIMWSSDEGTDHVIGFTRGSGAMAALTHAVKYAEEVTANVLVSVDGSDVSADAYWVTEDIWNAFAEKLEEAKTMIADGTAGNTACDTMLFELGNVLGGTEDLNSTGPMKMNPLGVVGNMAPGTMQ